MSARTFGELAQQHHQTTNVRCAFCGTVGLGTRYSTRHYVCDECIAPRRAELLPAIARAQAKARKAAARFAAEFKRAATDEEIQREADFLRTIYGCGEDYALECVRAALSSARRTGKRP